MAKRFSFGKRFAPFLLLALSCAGTVAEAELIVEDAWVREGPPNASVLAAYMLVRNLSDRDQTLVGVDSPAFQGVEIHRTEIRDGVARMLAQERLAIRAGADLVFEPGGYHLMLMGAMRPLRAGDTVTIVLQLAGGEEVLVTAPVSKGK